MPEPDNFCSPVTGVVRLCLNRDKPCRPPIQTGVAPVRRGVLTCRHIASPSSPPRARRSPSRSPAASSRTSGSLTAALVERGHDVTLFAPPGSDPRLPVRELDLAGLQLSTDARSDVSMPPEVAIREHHAYLSLMLELAADDTVRRHPQPQPALPAGRDGPHRSRTPMITTLHTPPTPWLESAVQAAPRSAMRFVAVSAYTARRWRPLLRRRRRHPQRRRPRPLAGRARRWPAGVDGADGAGEGAAPRDAGRPQGRPTAAARRPDRRPATTSRTRCDRCWTTSVTYVGHLDQAALSRLVGSASAALVTPMWDEPYGLVVAEALACGTPVAGLPPRRHPRGRRRPCARLVDGGDDAALAEAIVEAEALPRRHARLRAERHCSIESMMSRYEGYLDAALVA